MQSTKLRSRNRSVLRTCGVLVVLAVTAPKAWAETGFAKLERGPLGVGFRVVQQYDQSRAYKEQTDAVLGTQVTGERARPIQTLVWYPAAAQQAGARLTYADYLRTEATDENFERPKSEIEAFLAKKLKAVSGALGPAQAQAAFAQRMWAVRDAVPLAGKYPVVIYAPGGGSAAHEAADLGEYFASHGYVVISSRNLGTHSYQMNFDREGAETQTRDIGFLVAYAHTLPFADPTHLAAAGWSWGGMANVFAAAADNRISAIISFDGTREPELTRTISPSRVTIPWLYISRKLATISDLNRRGIDTSFSLHNALKYAELYQLVMQPMVHSDFSSEDLRFEPPSHFTDYTRDEVEQAYFWAVKTMLEFANAYLKSDATSLAFMQRSPTQNGAPRHLALYEHRAADPGPLATRAGFAAELAKRGFDHAVEVYGALHARDATFVLSDSDLNAWGYQLLPVNLPAAIEIFKLGTSVYATNSNLHDSLGEAYELAGNKPLAIASYRRSLELDPANGHAVTRLEALK